MSATAEKTDPQLWDRVKRDVTAGDKGGRPGQWSARKAQLAVQSYKAKGGRYKGGKTADNHLVQWEKEKWGTKSGKKSAETGERYLPKKARKALTKDEYKRTTATKRKDTRAGRQFSAQPRDIARKTAPYRARTAAGEGAETRGVLYRRAKERNIPGRSHMTKEQLRRALAR